MANKEYPVEIRFRSMIKTYPKLGHPAYTVATDFYNVDAGPLTAYVLLEEVGPEAPEEYWRQIEAKKGPLWTKFQAAERKAMRDKLEAALKQKPERATV